MSDPNKVDEQAGKLLVDALAQSLTHKTLQQVAAEAYIQGLVSSTALQAVLLLLARKNVLSPIELARAVADAYDLARRNLATGAIQLATQMPTVNGRN